MTDPGRALEDARRFAVRQRLRYRTWRRCGHAYAAPIDPFRIVRIDPGAIAHVLPRERRDHLESADVPHVQSVETGDWDLATDRFVETTCYQSLRDRFREGASWHETEYATVLERDLRSRERNGWDDAASVADGLRRHRVDGLRLRERYAALESIYERATSEGVPARVPRDRSRARAAGDPPARADWLLDDPRPAANAGLPPSKTALQVAIGRDGRLILHRGRHGLAIARLAGLESVPVHVLVRHERWQARRDRIVLTGSDDGDHPDLAGLAPT